jgi:hypothetical protein
LRTKKYPLAALEYDEEKNILYFRVAQDQIVDVAEITEMIEYVKEFLGEKEHYAVVDFGGSLSSSGEARAIYAASDYIQKYRMADAFLVKSLAVRLVANFFINVNRPKVNTKLFTDEDAAVKWLQGLQKKKKDKVK